MYKGYIAAIAGSAGCQEALIEFFSHTPHDGVSYVVLRHLPLHFKSELKSILKRFTGLAVCDITSGQRIKPDTVHIAGPGCYATLRGHYFVSVPRTGRIDCSGDIFMKSLAMQAGERSIGVVLSGALSDGSEGLAIIHEVGGLTLVQDPATARFVSMPICAINTGVVDHIVSCDEMPGIIYAHAHAGRIAPVI